jgi:hypothetical protein
MMYCEVKRSLLHNLGQLTVQLDTLPDKVDQFATLDAIEKLAKKHKAELRSGFVSSNSAALEGANYALTIVRRNTSTTKWPEVSKELRTMCPQVGLVWDMVYDRWTTSNMRTIVSVSELKR